MSISKAKLPRKRKKRAIKAQGRKWYYDTIKLWEITQASGKFHEPRCKFWVNESIKMVPFVTKDGRVVAVPQPTKFF